MPELLYHYTDAQGLKGILEQHTLRATNMAFLNDESELTYAEGVLNQVLERIVARLPDSDPRRALEYILKVYKGIFMELPLYACCFCARGDLLSMWRGYGAGSGYSIGFRARPLKAIELIYSATKQETLLEGLIEKFVNDTESTSSSAPITDANLADKVRPLSLSLYMQMIKFKDEAFSEEKEWRCIEGVASDDVDLVRYRVGNFGFVPYVTLDRLTKDERRLPIKEVIYGPSMHPALTEQGLRIALDKNGYQQVTIRRSSVPLRVMSPSLGG